MGNQLMIRLPGLISSVRNLRDPMHGLMCNTESNEEVVQLATELLGCQDDKGQNALLHSLQIQPSDCGVAGFRCSFQFNQLNEFRAAMVYWTSRMILTRICITLLRIGFSLGNNTEESLHSLAEGTAMNILMSVNHGGQLGYHPRKLVMNGISRVWGFLNDFACFRDWPSDPMKPRVLDMLHNFGEESVVTATEMDLIANAWIGGPSEVWHSRQWMRSIASNSETCIG